MGNRYGVFRFVMLDCVAVVCQHILIFFLQIGLKEQQLHCHRIAMTFVFIQRCLLPIIV